jgi:D-alanyl-D-alanine carboxypeptidase (penicillin-binding protein 5/6)
VTTEWGSTAQLVTDADLSLLLWNGATAPVASDLDLGDARTSGSAAGSVSTKGPLGSASTGVHLNADLPGPDAWWRLTHPLQLWGLAR